MNWLILVIFWFISPFTFEKDDLNLYRTSNGTITFKSAAPLETITAKSEVLKGIINVSEGTFAFSVPIRSFNGFNSKLQMEHFNENYMETDKFPNATFSGKIIETVDFAKDSIYVIRAKGAFVIHGVKQERLIKVQVETKNNSIFVSSNFIVELSDHNISIPRIVQQKISPEIEITVNALLFPNKL
jgi:polyisoprenoid-binding protein YceI